MTKTCEVTAFVDGVILRGVEKSDDMYKSIDLVFDKVERQIHKYKTRLAKRFKESNVLNKQFVSEKESVPGEVNLRLSDKSVLLLTQCLRKKLFYKWIYWGTIFYVFNSETEAMAVVYRRDDGKYGLIDAAK